MRIAFLGSGEFGLPTLRALHAKHTLALVVSQPDKPAGRGRVLTPTPIAEWAANHAGSVPLLKPADINSTDSLAAVRAVAGPGSIDAWVVIAFGQKLSADLVDGIWAINLHASLLPRWRGAAPINAAIVAGDSVTGNSVITIAQRMDAGLILGTTQRPIDPMQTAGELHDQLSADGPSLVLDVLERHARGEDRAQPQDESRVTKAKKLSKTDSVIDWSQTAEQVQRRVHGLTPWPGVAVMLNGLSIKLLRVDIELVVGRAAVDGTDATSRANETSTASTASARSETAVDGSAGVPACGTIVHPRFGHVLCGQGSMLRLCEVQPAGSRAMSWSDFTAGHAVKVGDRFV